MKMVHIILFLANFLVCSALAATSRTERSVYETPDNIIAAGYVSETHHAITDDGYILEMHRVPYRRGESTGDEDRPVVFVMHGLMAASNSFILLGPDYSVAFNLADAGFDVWLGNARGTKNSRFHVTMNPDTGREERIEFFDFTWEEIGMLDIAAMVDYVLEATGKEQLHYIGHSQGGTVFLVLNTMRPEYNAKFASAHLLAGVGYMTYFPHGFLRTLAMFSDPIWRLALALGLVEVFPPRTSNNYQGISNDTANFNIADYCTGDVTLKELCELTGIREITENIIQYNNTIEDALNMAGGASLKQIAHYGQNVQDQTFRRWNYGPEQNFEIYGSTVPPIYNLSLITVDVTMHYTVSDVLLDERDVLAMERDMPNTRARRVARDSFSHADFVFALDAKELVTDYIIEAIENSTNGTDDPTDSGATPSLVLGVILNSYLIILSFYVVLTT